MSRWRRLRISLLVGAVPVLAIAIGGLWGTAEEGGFDADACGSIIHRASDSAFCRGALTETYASKLVAALVAGLLVTSVVYGLLALVAWIRTGRRPRSSRRRGALAGGVAAVLVLATITTVAVAHQTGPNPCQPAARPVPAARGDRVEVPFGDPGATGAVTVTPPRGTLTPAWCASVDDEDLASTGSLPVASHGVLFGSDQGDSHIRAIDLTDGRSRWTSPATGIPVGLAGQTLVVNDYDQLAALDARTGSRRWTSAVLVSPSGNLESVTVSGNRVFVTAEDIGANQAWLDLLDLRTGRLLARRALESRLVEFMSVPVADGGVTVALEASPPPGSGSPGTSVVKIAAVGPSTRLVHLDATTLAPEWQATVPGEVDRLLADGGTVVASAVPRSESPFWAVWGAADGQLRWTHAVVSPCGLESVLADGPQLITAIGGPSSCGGTFAWDLATGIPRWRATNLGAAWLSGGQVVGADWIGRRGGATVATLDAADGQGYRVVATMPSFVLQPVVVAGLVLARASGPHPGLEAYTSG